MATFDIGTRVKVIGQDITGKIIRHDFETKLLS